MASEAPRECWTCRHRKPIKAYACVGAAIFRQTCREYRHDLLGKAQPMACNEACDRFYGGGDWKPTLAARIGMILGRKL